MIGMDFSIHVRYGRLICHKKLHSDRPRCSILELHENMGASASQPTNWLFLGVERLIIPHVKEGNQGYLLI